MASGSISGVIWIAVVGGLALLGFIGLAVSAVMLKHTADDVMAALKEAEHEPELFQADGSLIDDLLRAQRESGGLLGV